MEDEEYKPISPLGYIGYQLLFAIPVIGFICVLVFSIGSKNRNVKNYSRAHLIVYLFTFLIAGFFILFTIMSGVTMEEFINQYTQSQAV